MSGNLHERFYNLQKELEAKQAELLEIKRKFEAEIQKLKDKKQAIEEQFRQDKRSVTEEMDDIDLEIKQTTLEIETRYNELMQAKKAKSND